MLFDVILCFDNDIPQVSSNKQAFRLKIDSDVYDGFNCPQKSRTLRFCSMFRTVRLIGSNMASFKEEQTAGTYSIASCRLLTSCGSDDS